MHVIKSLDATENSEQREQEKLKIEREFKKTDKNLNELVSRHDNDLGKVIFYNFFYFKCARS